MAARSTNFRYSNIFVLADQLPPTLRDESRALRTTLSPPQPLQGLFLWRARFGAGTCDDRHIKMDRLIHNNREWLRFCPEMRGLTPLHIQNVIARRLHSRPARTLSRRTRRRTHPREPATIHGCLEPNCSRRYEYLDRTR